MLFRKMVECAGAIYNGLQKCKDERFVVFTDPMTQTTMMIDIKHISIAKIRFKIYHARDLFKKYAEGRKK